MKLDIGCGIVGWQRTPNSEWTHLDKVAHVHVEIVCDFGEIPLETGSVDEIFLGDVVEHVPVWRRAEVFAEWSRILKDGGVVNGKMPNPARALRAIAGVGDDMSVEDAMGALYGKGYRPEEVHYRTYTPDSLAQAFMPHQIIINSFEGSPGPQECPWWYVFHGVRVFRA